MDRIVRTPIGLVFLRLGFTGFRNVADQTDAGAFPRRFVLTNESNDFSKHEIPLPFEYFEVVSLGTLFVDTSQRIGSLCPIDQLRISKGDLGRALFGGI